MSRIGGRASVAVVVALALSACSTTVPGEAVPAEVVLDTGNYSTVPRDVPPRVGDDAAVQGNIALGDYVVVPAEVDAAFDWSLYRVFPSLPDSNSVYRMMGAGLWEALENGRVSGVVAPATTEGANSETAPQATFIVLRYSDEAKAKSAFDGVSKIPPSSTGTAPANHPSSYVGPRPESFRAGPTIWLQHNEYVLAAAFANIESGERVSRLAGAFFDRQLPKLDTVPFPPEGALKQPADKDGILRRTRVDSTDVGTVKYTTGYYSIHVFLMNATGRRSSAKDRYAVHGIDLIAYEGRNQVLRAANGARAADYVRQTGIGTGDDSARGFLAEVAVPGVRGSQCHSTVAALYGRPERVFSCAVSHGRYVAAAQGASLLQAQQGAAASYLVLKNAE